MTRELRRALPRPARRRPLGRRHVQPGRRPRAGSARTARGVDLNRNFPYRWRANGSRGSRYWGGRRPLSEPESRADPQARAAAAARGDGLVPPALGRGARLRGVRRSFGRRYARLAGMGTSCRGSRPDAATATSWQNAQVGGGTAFVVELGGGRVPDSASRGRNARAAAIVAQRLTRAAWQHRAHDRPALARPAARPARPAAHSARAARAVRRGDRPRGVDEARRRRLDRARRQQGAQARVRARRGPRAGRRHDRDHRRRAVERGPRDRGGVRARSGCAACSC